MTLVTLRRFTRIALATIAVSAMAVTTARAQGTPASPRTPSAAPPWEVALTTTWARGLSIGPLEGSETQPSGADFALFTAQSRIDNISGLAVTITRHLSGPFSVEADGVWSRITYRTSVLSDFENATLIDVTNAATEFGVAGAAVVTFARHSRLQPFVRGGGGWRRELSNDQTFSTDGYLVIAGGGVKYWWGANAATSRVGLRADVGLVGRSNGLATGDKIRFAPGASAGLSLRF